MAQKEYIVEGRRFRTEADYKLALRDQEKLTALRKNMAGADVKTLEQLRAELRSGKHHFHTLLGQDFEDELSDRIRELEKTGTSPGTGKNAGKKTAKSAGKSGKPAADKRKNTEAAKISAKTMTAATRINTVTQVSEKAVLEELKKQEKRRKRMIAACTVIAAASLGYFGVYVYFNQRTGADYENLQNLKEKVPLVTSADQAEPVIHYTDDIREIPDVLDEYKNLLIKNKKLIGWVKIDDTKIDYPVMQTTDNEYYLTHNLNQEYDKNGCIFMDKDCDVLKPSTNLILYGHHMKSGRMFGTLSKYADEKFYKEHPRINFDTIYEKGVYEVMYVFRSRVYNESDVVFKYYQFIDAMSEVEFDSYMKEMEEESLYDTGVRASFGDRLLTLSTCDYQEKNGRFVVVARRIETE